MKAGEVYADPRRESAPVLTALLGRRFGPGLFTLFPGRARTQALPPGAQGRRIHRGCAANDPAKR